MLDEKLLASLYGISQAKALLWLPYFKEAIKVAKLNTRERLVCFLAQVGHESGQLLYTTELWGPTKSQVRYEPVTSLSKQLGNVSVGSGKRYMGRGLIQITGEANFKMVTVEMRKLVPDCPDFHKNPEQLAYKRYAMLSAAIFWNNKKLNTFCDSYDFVKLTKKINGGTNGLAHRQALRTKALTLMV